MAYGARLESGLGEIPQGFKSPILRQHEGGLRAALVHFPHVVLVESSAVACPSGQRSAPRKRVWGQPHRGFKSHRHRHGVLTKVGTPDLRNPPGGADRRFRGGFRLSRAVRSGAQPGPVAGRDLSVPPGDAAQRVVSAISDYVWHFDEVPEQDA